MITPTWHGRKISTAFSVHTNVDTIQSDKFQDMVNDYGIDGYLGGGDGPSYDEIISYIDSHTARAVERAQAEQRRREPRVMAINAAVGYLMTATHGSRHPSTFIESVSDLFDRLIELRQDEQPMPLADAVYYADHWRNNKLLGGDPYEVSKVLLSEIERLQKTPPANVAQAGDLNVSELADQIRGIECRARGTPEQISLYQRGHTDARNVAALLVQSAIPRGAPIIDGEEFSGQLEFRVNDNTKSFELVDSATQGVIAHVPSIRNARRFLAVWRYCASATTEELETGPTRADQKKAAFDLRTARLLLSMTAKTPIPDKIERYLADGVGPIQLWMEGYTATGEHAQASFEGMFWATDLRDAVKQWSEEPTAPGRKVTLRLDQDPPSHWSCGFFDNEADARKRYG
jgi:hypothetical protein